MPDERTRRFVSECLTDEYLSSQKGRYVDHRHYHMVLGGEDVDVLKPDGSPLLLLRTNALPIEICRRARPVLRRASKFSAYRRNIWSGIIGSFDIPKCRKTAFTANDVDGWARCLPYIRAANVVFNRELPERYAAQREACLQTPGQYVIGGTVFSTVTVNRWDDYHDARTPLHRDAGDLREGFGVITALTSGSYEAGHLIYPRYGVAVDLRTTDVLLCDLHEWHANAPVVGQPGWERISTVMYFRSAMRNC